MKYTKIISFTFIGLALALGLSFGYRFFFISEKPISQVRREDYQEETQQRRATTIQIVATSSTKTTETSRIVSPNVVATLSADEKVRIFPKFGDYALGGRYESPYFKDKNNVYMIRHDSTFDKIDSADPGTFTVDIKRASTTDHYYDGLEFSQDKNHVYFRGKLTKFSLDFILINSGSEKDCGFGPYVLDYFKGKKVIYTQIDRSNENSFMELKDADPDTFEVLWTGYSKDKDRVYSENEITKEDPKTFDLKAAYDKCPLG